MAVNIVDLLLLCMEKEASDLHLTANMPPILRIHGTLTVVEDFPPIKRDELRRMIYGCLTDMQKQKFEKELELDFSLHFPNTDRFRINVHMQRGSVEAAFRRVSSNVPDWDFLGLPPVVKELARKPNGLILVTGPTGVGKSTTLAAMVNLINEEFKKLIITVEDPIEYLHRHKNSIVKQREVHQDTLSFANALRHVLRQDPDVIVVGEMRDLETISTAITAAETGHLVLATLHTVDAAQTVERVIDVFPPHQQQQIRLQLADCLQAVMSQQLFKKKDGSGRVLAVEIMICTPAIRNVIREMRIEQIPNLIQTGAKYGMQTMDNAIQKLYADGLISYEDSVTYMKNPSLLNQVTPRKEGDKDEGKGKGVRFWG